MIYWKRERQVQKEKTKVGKMFQLKSKFQTFEDADITSPPLKPGPRRKLTLDDEFLVTLIKFRLGLLVDDLSFRFKISKHLFLRYVQRLSV